MHVLHRNIIELVYEELSQRIGKINMTCAGYLAQIICWFFILENDKWNAQLCFHCPVSLIFSHVFSHSSDYFSSYPSATILQLTTPQDKKLNSLHELKLKVISARLLRLPSKTATIRTMSKLCFAQARNEISCLQCTSLNYRYVWIINYIVFVNKGSEANPVFKQSSHYAVCKMCVEEE